MDRRNTCNHTPERRSPSGRLATALVACCVHGAVAFKASSPKPTRVDVLGGAATVAAAAFLGPRDVSAAVLFPNGGASDSPLGALICLREQCGEPVWSPAANALVGTTILITGGSDGVGFESAQRLARAGARIVVTGERAGRKPPRRGSADP